MAVVKLRPCLRCGRLTSAGSYCKTHAPQTGRGSTRQWRKLRAAILARDRHRCRKCGHPATHVDHITPVKLGGKDVATNLQVLCARCNLEKGSDPA